MRKALQAWMLAAALVPAALVGQDLNVTRPAVELERLLAEAPMRIVSAEISRPKAKGDITLKAEVAFGDEPPMRVKLRKSMPGADEFNNVPRYDLAAQELQKLLVDPVDYFVPPTALRFVPIDELRRYTDDVRPTFRGSDEVLAVVQYWLQEVKVVEDVLGPARFAADPVYARHIGQLNVFTYLIDHRDSNVGNFLISHAEASPSPRQIATAGSCGPNCASTACPRVLSRGCARWTAGSWTRGSACSHSGGSWTAASSPRHQGRTWGAAAVCGSSAASCRWA